MTRLCRLRGFVRLMLLAVVGLTVSPRIASAQYEALHAFDGDRGVLGYAGGSAPIAKAGGGLCWGTQDGGRYGQGTVVCEGRVIYEFPARNSPYAAVSGLASVGDVLIGTTSSGGPTSSGSIFQLSLDGAFTELFRFERGVTGEQPAGALHVVGNTLYGTTMYGGRGGAGTIYSFDLATRSFKTLYELAGADGRMPLNGVVSHGGWLYGTALSGGASSQGTVFRLQLDGTRFQKFHDFNARTVTVGPTTFMTAQYPRGLVVHVPTMGPTRLYGLAYPSAVFAFNLPDLDTSTTPNIYYYGLGKNADIPSGVGPVGSPVMGTDGRVYFTTQYGGKFDAGTIMGVEPLDSTWAPRIVHSFEGRAGRYPYTGVTIDTGAATCYLSGQCMVWRGLTLRGGSEQDAGTQYTVAESKCDTSIPGTTCTVPVHSYRALMASIRPIDPRALATASTGQVYGVSQFGGRYGKGTIFRVVSGMPEAIYEFTPPSFDPTRSEFRQPTALVSNGDALLGIARVERDALRQPAIFLVTPAGEFNVLYEFPIGVSSDLTLISGKPGYLYGYAPSVPAFGLSPFIFEFEIGSRSVRTLRSFASNSEVRSFVIGPDDNLYVALARTTTTPSRVYRLTTTGTWTAVADLSSDITAATSLVNGPGGWMYGLVDGTASSLVKFSTAGEVKYVAARGDLYASALVRGSGSRLYTMGAGSVYSISAEDVVRRYYSAADFTPYALTPTGEYLYGLQQEPRSAGTLFRLNRCLATLSGTSLSMPASGGERTITIDTDEPCNRTASSNVSWLTVTPASGTGKGAVTIAATANTESSTRTGTLTIAGQTVSITQSAAPAPSTTPTNLASQVSGSKLTLTWNAPTSGPAVTGYRLEAGFATGQTAMTVPLGVTTSFVADAVAPGTYYLRVRAITATAVSDPSNEITVTIAGPSAPGPPSRLAASVDGNTLTLAWSAPTSGGTPTTYYIDAGSAANQSDVASVPTGSTATSFRETAPNGTYFLRVRAGNFIGASAASNEVKVTIGPPPCTAAPAAPTNLQSSVAGGVATLTWTAPSGPLSGYRLDAALTAGGAAFVTLPTGSTTPRFSGGAPPGTYYVRVRAVNACGVGAASDQAVVVVH